MPGVKMTTAFLKIKPPDNVKKPQTSGRGGENDNIKMEIKYTGKLNIYADIVSSQVLRVSFPIYENLIDECLLDECT